MSDEFLQLVATAIVVLSQIYFLEPWKFPIFAKFWDWLARVCGNTANLLAWLSIHARANYFTAISEMQ